MPYDHRNGRIHLGLPHWPKSRRTPAEPKITSYGTLKALIALERQALEKRKARRLKVEARRPRKFRVDPLGCIARIDAILKPQQERTEFERLCTLGRRFAVLQATSGKARTCIPRRPAWEDPDSRKRAFRREDIAGSAKFTTSAAGPVPSDHSSYMRLQEALLECLDLWRRTNGAAWDWQRLAQEEERWRWLLGDGRVDEPWETDEPHHNALTVARRLDSVSGNFQGCDPGGLGSTEKVGLLCASEPWVSRKSIKASSRPIAFTRQIGLVRWWCEPCNEYTLHKSPPSPNTKVRGHGEPECLGCLKSLPLVPVQVKRAEPLPTPPAWCWVGTGGKLRVRFLGRYQPGLVLELAARWDGYFATRGLPTRDPRRAPYVAMLEMPRIKPHVATGAYGSICPAAWRYWSVREEWKRLEILKGWWPRLVSPGVRVRKPLRPKLDNTLLRRYNAKHGEGLDGEKFLAELDPQYDSRDWDDCSEQKLHEAHFSKPPKPKKPRTPRPAQSPLSEDDEQIIKKLFEVVKQ